MVMFSTFSLKITLVASLLITPIDGDTIRVAGETVRLLGFDAPEIFHARCEAEARLGLLAKRRLEYLIEHNVDIKLVYTGRRGKYGRLLARLLINGNDVSEILIKEGYARRYSGGHRDSWCSFY